MRSSSSSLWWGISVSTIFRNGKTKEKAGADRGAASVTAKSGHNLADIYRAAASVSILKVCGVEVKDDGGLF